MKIAVLNIYDDGIKELAVITTEYNKRKYCEKHGYDLVCKTENFKYVHLGFEKIHFIKETLQSGKYDWVYWCGTDTMITNYNIKIEQLIDDDFCFIIAGDVWEWNSDSMLFKNDPKTMEFLEKILSKHDLYVDQNNNPIKNGVKLKDGCEVAWGEQAAMIEECKKEIFSHEIKDEYKNFVKEVSQKTMNSYLYDLYPTPFHAQKKDYRGNDGQWAEGDFLVHWPGTHMNARLQMAINFIKLVKE